MNYNKLIILSLLFFSSSFCATVSENDAIKIAKNLFSTKFNEFDTMVNSIKTIEVDQINCLYIVNLNSSGFVIVSADNRVYPILGYSNNNIYSELYIPVQLSDMITFYKKQIHYAIENDISSNPSIDEEWNYYLSNDLQYENHRNVEPLFNLNWDQGHSWNDHCPEDNQGPGGNAYAGCVATAAAMVMKYWNHPEYGENSHAYYHNDYGLVSADFNTLYNWEDMNNNSPTESSRELLFHLGVSVEMQYGPSGSGAWVGEYEPSLTSALKNYFKYSSETTFLSKDNYDDIFWLDMVKTELDQGRPLIYKGYTEDLGAGHAFVINGYDEDYFHLNWGWSGSYNGWYLISNLSPGGYNFSTWQGAIINLYPEIEQIFGCTDFNACNYDENANIDDSSCEYLLDCDGICGGDAELDVCGECGGDGSTCAGNAIINFGLIDSQNQTIDIIFESDIDIAGFQFSLIDIPNNIILDSFNGGISYDSGFTVSCSEDGIVIGFSIEGNIIPQGSGLLTTANYSIIGNESNCEICFQDIILSNDIGNAINIDWSLIDECNILDLCQYSGNMNYDDLINILDVVVMINMILEIEDISLCESDINQDDILNVQDIIILINIILQQ